MSESADNLIKSFVKELVVILQRGREIWNLIPVRQRGTLILAILLMALAGASNTAIPLFLGKLIDAVQGNSEQNGISESAASVLATAAMMYLALIGLAYLLREAFGITRRYLIEDTCTRLERHLFVTLISHLLMADLATLSREKVGTLHGRVTRSVGGSLKFLRVGFLDFLPALLTGGFALAAVFAKQPWLGVMMLGVIPVSLLITMRQLVSQKGVRLELLHSREEMDGTVVEQLSGIDYIRTAHTHAREIERVSRAAETLRVKELRHHFVMSLFGSGKALNEGLFYILTLALAVYLAEAGRISVGDILTFSMLYLNAMAPLNEVHRIIDEGHESSLLVGELLTMLAEPPDRSYRAPEIHKSISANGQVIQVENLCVDYSLAQEHPPPALKGVSLAIERGEVVGIAGRSGCGKTTLLRTLMRLVHPQCGRVLMNGVPLESVSREDIARWVGYVGQSPFVFSGTIANNIAYERPDASAEEIRRAAKLACLDDEIQNMPGGYQALLTERGQNLSGGQKQRLALARVFLKNPLILILDEATSALDTISEHHVQEALATIQGDHTILLVAHRLSTLLQSDRILVFEEGQIVETGTYGELAKRNGVFSELVRSASRKEE